MGNFFNDGRTLKFVPSKRVYYMSWVSISYLGQELFARTSKYPILQTRVCKKCLRITLAGFFSRSIFASSFERHFAL